MILKSKDTFKSILECEKERGIDSKNNKYYGKLLAALYLEVIVFLQINF